MTIIQNKFPLDNDLVYLNHPAVAPWPQRTADAIKQFTDENLHHKEFLEIIYLAP